MWSSFLDSPAGMHKGAAALLWGEPRVVRRGGNPPAPAFPAGEMGKGAIHVTLLPQANFCADQGRKRLTHIMNAVSRALSEAGIDTMSE